MTTTTKSGDPESGELGAAQREATAAVRDLEAAATLGIEAYAARAKAAADALANLSSLASLAARRARR